MPSASKPSHDAMLDTWGRRNRKIADKTCKHCGVSYRPKRESSNYCSRPCQRANNGRPSAVGENWWINAKGYCEGRIWIDDKPVRVKRHGLLVEQYLGRKLLPDEDVHHIDGNKLNNELSNLQVIDHSSHTTITNTHRWHKARAALRKADGETA